MTEPVILSFYPVHEDLDEEEHERRIAEYRAWLDQHGDYGRLYMMDIGKRNLTDRKSSVIGVKIYQPEIATLFKLMFEV